MREGMNERPSCRCRSRPAQARHRQLPVGAELKSAWYERSVQPEFGTLRIMPFLALELWIEREDFMEVPSRATVAFQARGAAASMATWSVHRLREG